jgi:hypothetical protein
MGFVSFVSDTVGEVFRKLSLLVRQQSLLQVMQLMQLMQLLQIQLANSISSPYIMLTCA